MATDAYWLDTGTPERYLQAQFDVLSGLRPNVELPTSEQVTALAVHLAAGAKMRHKRK